MESQNTPFWLEIKTEYIDANLDKVISYLSKESQVPGPTLSMRKPKGFFPKG